MCRPIFISPKQLRYRGIWKPSAGWNSMGRLVVPFLQSPEPVLEKNSTTATSTASAWHEVNASMPGLSDVRCVVVLRWTGGPVINLRYPPRQTQPFHQLDRSVWIVTTSRETAGQASQAFTPSRAPSTLQCVRTCLYHWNAPSWFPSQVIFHIVTSLGPQQLSKTWHYHIRASFKARLSKKGVPLSPISFEKKTDSFKNAKHYNP